MMGSLPAEQRDTLLAVTLHGLGARDYSGVTGTPRGTVKTCIRRRRSGDFG
jgi:DNA-directed RNA polymerase specialized sigma24 family protein